MVSIIFAYTTAYCTTVRKSVAYAETNHSILSCATFWKFRKPLAHNLECVTIVEVIAVQNGKRLVNYTFAHHQGVVSTPRLSTTFGACETFGQCVEGLEYEFARNVTFIFRQYNATEVFFKVLADYEY